MVPGQDHRERRWGGMLLTFSLFSLLYSAILITFPINFPHSACFTLMSLIFLAVPGCSFRRRRWTVTTQTIHQNLISDLISDLISENVSDEPPLPVRNHSLRYDYSGAQSRQPPDHQQAEDGDHDASPRKQSPPQLVLQVSCPQEVERGTAFGHRLLLNHEL